MVDSILIIFKKWFLRTKRFPPSGVNFRGGGGLSFTGTGTGTGTGCTRIGDGVTTTDTGGGDSLLGEFIGGGDGSGGCSSFSSLGNGDGETSVRAGVSLLVVGD